MQATRYVSLATVGEDQVLTIPSDLALAGTTVALRKDGDRLIIEPIPSQSLLAVLATLEEVEVDFPDVDEGLLSLEEVDL